MANMILDTHTANCLERYLGTKRRWWVAGGYINGTTADLTLSDLVRSLNVDRQICRIVK